MKNKQKIYIFYPLVDYAESVFGVIKDRVLGMAHLF